MQQQGGHLAGGHVVDALVAAQCPVVVEEVLHGLVRRGEDAVGAVAVGRELLVVIHGPLAGDAWQRAEADGVEAHGTLLVGRGEVVGQVCRFLVGLVLVVEGEELPELARILQLGVNGLQGPQHTVHLVDISVLGDVLLAVHVDDVGVGHLERAVARPSRLGEEIGVVLSGVDALRAEHLVGEHGQEAVGVIDEDVLVGGVYDTVGVGGGDEVLGLLHGILRACAELIVHAGLHQFLLLRGTVALRRAEVDELLLVVAII